MIQYNYIFVVVVSILLDSARSAYLLPRENELLVNKITSTKTLLPKDYYSLPFCRPENGILMVKENFGQLLAGDRIQNTPYAIMNKKEMYCEQVCIADLGPPENNLGGNNNTIIEAIRENYHTNWILGGLPAASMIEDDSFVTTRFWQGIPIGYIAENSTAYIFNHMNIEIMYQPLQDMDQVRITRLTIEPFSIKHDFELVPDGEEEVDDSAYLPHMAIIHEPITSCDRMTRDKQHTYYEMVTAHGREPQPAIGKVLFTYDVIWRENGDMPWAARWDVYLSMDSAVPARVHWLSIANSFVVAVVISAVVIAITKCMIRDISNYRTATKDGPALAEQVRGWKAIQNDVFRPPSFSPMLLSVVCGTGAQLLCTTLLIIVFGASGLLSASHRGRLLMAAPFLFASMGGFNGYVTARLYKAFGGKRWKLAAAIAALTFPGIFFGTVLMINKVAFIGKSTYVIRLETVAIMIAAWLGLMAPLVFFGTYIGFRQNSIEFPLQPSGSQRPIPVNPLVNIFIIIPLALMLGGALPFGSCFVELYYIMASFWQGYYYSVFGFLFLVLLVTTITCSVIAVLFTFVQLRWEDYGWWWRSFNNAGSMGIYVFLYSCIYFKNIEANNRLATKVFYFGYMALFSLGLFLMMGFIGVCASLWFNKMIFFAPEEESDQPLVTTSSEGKDDQLRESSTEVV